MKIINKEETLGLIDFPGLIKTAEEAYSIQSSGTQKSAYYINMPINKGDFAHYKVGFKPESKYFVLKYSGGFWSNGGDNSYGYVIVHDSSTGEPLYMFQDNDTITNYRTAAAGAFTSKLLSNEDSHRVGLIGTGIQARLQIEALTHVRNIDTVKVWGRNEEKVDIYVEEMQAKFPKIKFVKCQNPEEATIETDILVTVTYSDKPIIMPEWLKPGMHIAAVGACGPEMQEFDSKAMSVASKVYVDSIDKAALDGELHHALEDGGFKLSDLTGELGEVVNGKVKGREGQDEITFADLVGLGIQDATAAEYLLSKLQ
ncbi:ornithine cyclodeaminase family protein [Candidatus Dojkabacteria bacterium]|uniref:Ornithine cyclodeaminase family protein n=1 Tax=Candidatus Dojkabacteria bacterium TaxID=2099670 RepID=A0A955L395_9BACT|nr:ornithine cyclodeaminase family protein [Candidatus Dojkabacteria bacterium]